MTGARFVRAVAATSTCVLLAGCSLIEPSPARTNAAFRAKAIDTADSVNSSVQTALLTITLLQTGKVTANAAAVQIDDANDGVTGPHHAFDRVQPPSSVSDDTETQLDGLLNQVDAQMSSLSTSIHRHRFDNLSDSSTVLLSLSMQLQEFTQAQQ